MTGLRIRGGNAYWIDRAFARHLVLIYYWVNVVYYWLFPMSAYHLSLEVEEHAAQTYSDYLMHVDRSDKRIYEIMEDEIHHVEELRSAMELL